MILRSTTLLPPVASLAWGTVVDERNVFVGIFGPCRDLHAIDEHWWRRPFGFHAQTANAFSDRYRIAFPRREPFHGFVVPVQPGRYFLGHDVAVSPAHAPFVAQV